MGVSMWVFVIGLDKLQSPTDAIPAKVTPMLAWYLARRERLVHTDALPVN